MDAPTTGPGRTGGRTGARTVARTAPRAAGRAPRRALRFFHRRGASRGVAGSAVWGVASALLLGTPTPAAAQLTDETQTPETQGEGIALSLEEQVGEGRGDVDTPGSSIYLIKRDPARSVRRGRQIFQRKFTLEQGLGPRSERGEGDLRIHPDIGAGLADSCASCHSRPRGSAGFGGSVFTRPDGRDAPHLFGVGLQEMLADEITRDLRAVRDEAVAEARFALVDVKARLVSKGIDFGAVIAGPDGSVDLDRVRGVDPDLRVRPFFAEGATISLREFIVAALSNELGLEAVDDDLCDATHPFDPVEVVTPSGMVLDPALDVIERPRACASFLDPDGDGVFDEIDVTLVDHLEFYLLNSFPPALARQDERTESGFRLMKKIGCTDCHVRNLVLERDRRAFAAEVFHLPAKASFNQLFARISELTEKVKDGTSPPLRQPRREPVRVRNIFSDFKRHDLGPAFHERQFDGSLETEFLTEPLWGVGSTAPYGHDGRSVSLRQVILRHGGEARKSRKAFQALSDVKQRRILDALGSLVLYPPDDTSSNLDRADPETEGYPQEGHGSIDLTPLFTTAGDE
ncbi:MAG: di-heme oxidoredictase family protein [Myxococcota bacterium]